MSNFFYNNWILCDITLRKVLYLGGVGALFSVLREMMVYFLRYEVAYDISCECQLIRDFVC